MMKAFQKTLMLTCIALLLGAVFHATLAQAQFTESVKIQPRNKKDGAGFGIKVAMSDDRAIVGAFGEDNLAGVAYIFEFSGGVWSQAAKIQASDRTDVDEFGISVGISSNHAIVGARSSGTGSDRTGAAYIFERNASGNWIQVTKIEASDKANGDKFGNSVAISGDRAIVGAYRDDNARGAAYIFERNASGNWTQVSKLEANDRADDGAEFGKVVAISANRAIIGAAAQVAIYRKAGAAYIFERNMNGEWTQATKCQEIANGAGDVLGCSVAINGDRAIVGAKNVPLSIEGQEPTPGNYAGAAFIFEREDNGTWNKVAKILASDIEKGDAFGISVAINGDRAIVGRIRGNNNNGAAYIFEHNATNGEWKQLSRIEAKSGATEGDFGNSVAISADHAIVGAPSEGTSGAVYSFDLSCIDADGNIYRTAQIGAQTWMAENLRTTKCSDGTAIPAVNDVDRWWNQSSAAYTTLRTYYGAAIDESELKNEYGFLYNWFAANSECNICPKGWRVPTQQDFITLLRYLNTELPKRTAHLKLMANDGSWTGSRGTITNSSGFTALPAGGTQGGPPDWFGHWAFFWSTTAKTAGKAYNFVIHANDAGAWGLSTKQIGFSIRCIKNE